MKNKMMYKITYSIYSTGGDIDIIIAKNEAQAIKKFNRKHSNACSITAIEVYRGAEIGTEMLVPKSNCDYWKTRADMWKQAAHDIRRETAEKIYEQLCGHGTTYVKKWIKEQYGVEIKEV